LRFIHAEQGDCKSQISALSRKHLHHLIRLDKGARLSDLFSDSRDQLRGGVSFAPDEESAERCFPGSLNGYRNSEFHKNISHLSGRMSHVIFVLLSVWSDRSKEIEEFSRHGGGVLSV